MAGIMDCMVSFKRCEKLMAKSMGKTVCCAACSMLTAMPVASLRFILTEFFEGAKLALPDLLASDFKYYCPTKVNKQLNFILSPHPSPLLAEREQNPLQQRLLAVYNIFNRGNDLKYYNESKSTVSC